MEQRSGQNDTYGGTHARNDVFISYQHSPQYNHHLVQSYDPANTNVGLPQMSMKCTTATTASAISPAQAVHCHQPQATANAATICSQHSQQQQLQNQPIYNQMYQSLHTYQPTPFQPSTFLTSPTFQDNNNTIVNRQNLFVNGTVRQQVAESGERRPNLSLNLQEQLLFQQQFQQPLLKSASMFSTAISHQQQQHQQQQMAEKSSLSMLPAHFIHQNTSSPAIMASNNTSAEHQHHHLHQWRPAGAAAATTTVTGCCEPTNPTKSTTTSQRSKLVGSSDSSSSSSSSSSPASANVCGKSLKNCLENLVLATNISAAYGLIMLFLITFIAATSLITILTIVVTITGYTAYPITESTFNTSLAIGVVCASFALALVTASLVVWRRHCQAAYYYLDDPQSASRGTNSPQLSETYDDSEYGSIPVNDWAKHVKKLHSDGDIGFSREFEQIQKSNCASLTYDHSQMAENKHKNRYINIVAYDHTRVVLRPLPGQKKPGSDYINANFIDVSLEDSFSQFE